MSHEPSIPNTEPSKAGAQMDPTQKLSPLIFSVVAGFVFIVCAFLSNGIHDLSTSALLALPVFALGVGSVILWRRLNSSSKPGNVGYYRLNLYAASACILFYCLLWLMYSQKTFYGHPSLLQAVSLAALGLISLLLLLVAFMTAAFIMELNDEPATKWLPRQCQYLRAGVKGEPLWAIALFFVLFLGVAYLFGFALAFHDRSALRRTDDKLPALHMVNLKSIDDDDTAVSTDKDSKGAHSETREKEAATTPTQSGAKVTSGGPEGDEFCFYFEERKANLNQSDANCNMGIPKRSEIYPAKIFNACSLKAIVDKLQKAMENGGRLKVSLLGHSDNEPIYARGGSGYGSNYELSRSRAENVQYEILQSLREKVPDVEDLRWAIFAAGAEPMAQVNRGAVREDMFYPAELAKMDIPAKSERGFFLERLQRRLSTEEVDHKLPAEQKRVVIATIEKIADSGVALPPDQIKSLTAGQTEALDKLKTLANAQREHISQSQAKPLQLMDYMYFSIYTITTTGYGDIVPTTAYAKFVTSLANICEVLFLVVFFNALISIKGDALNLSKTQTKQEDGVLEEDSKGAVRRFGASNTK